MLRSKSYVTIALLPLPGNFALLYFLFLFLLLQLFCLLWLYFLPCIALLILMLFLAFIHCNLGCVYLISDLYIFLFFASLLCLCLGHMWKQVTWTASVLHTSCLITQASGFPVSCLSCDFLGKKLVTKGTLLSGSRQSPLSGCHQCSHCRTCTPTAAWQRRHLLWNCEY